MSESDVWRRSPQELVRLWDVKTGINIPEFRRLSVGCNEGERTYVLDGLLHGFPLGINRAGPFPPRRLWAESKVSPAGRARITEYLLSERVLGRIYGPFSEPRGVFWADSVVYPMCEARRSDGRYRTISNLSFNSPLTSVNGFIPSEERATEYPSFFEVASSMVEIGLQRVYMGLFDVFAAYRNLRIACEDWRFGVIAWRDLVTHDKQFWLDAALVFGGASGCRIYNRFGQVLGWVLQTHCFDLEDGVTITQILKRYLDDHLLLCASFAQLEAVLDRMLALMAHLNVPVKDVKTIRGVVEMKFLGYFWCPRLDLVSLDPVRWASVEADLRVLMDLLWDYAASAHDLRCVVGLLVWSTRVIPAGKVFTRGLHQVISLYKATSMPAAQARRVRVVDDARIETALADLDWWLELCVTFRLGGSRPLGVSISEVVTPKVWTVSECGLVFHCDASNRGLGGFMDGHPSGHFWVFVPLPRGITLSWSKTSRSRGTQNPDDPKSVSSGYCEAAGLLLSLLTFLPIWAADNLVRPAGVGVWAYSDSMVVVDMWAAKKACDTMLPYLRAFAHLEAFYSITLIVTHIEGKLNTTADSISRQEWAKFRELQPTADLLSLPVPLGVTLFL